MAATNITTTIEPFRKGTSFADWFERIELFFSVNNVQPDMKRGYFVTLGGPVIFSELKLLFPTTSVQEIPYEEMTSKLKSRLDKTESDLIQRLKFNNRVQQPDETVEDFILSVKLQEEFCTFGTFKNTAVRDRILAGLRDNSLRQRLLTEENLTLESAEKIIATWELAGTNNRNLTGTAVGLESIAYLRNQGRGPIGSSLNRLANTFQMAHNSNTMTTQNGSYRGPVKNRLGFRATERENSGERYKDRRFSAYKTININLGIGERRIIGNGKIMRILYAAFVA